jgi:hypothetical protein
MPATTIKPITGMLRRGLVLDLSVAFGTSPPFRMASESGTQLWTAPGGAIGRSYAVIYAPQVANMHSHRSRYRCWLLLVVRYVKTVCALATRQTSFNAREPSQPTRTSKSGPPKPCEHSTLTRASYRLPRSCRPPPRHVLRQA